MCPYVLACIAIECNALMLPYKPTVNPAPRTYLSRVCHISSNPAHQGRNDATQAQAQQLIPIHDEGAVQPPATTASTAIDASTSAVTIAGAVTMGCVTRRSIILIVRHFPTFYSCLPRYWSRDNLPEEAHPSHGVPGGAWQNADDVRWLINAILNTVAL
jgi:hypothetical protein